MGQTSVVAGWPVRRQIASDGCAAVHTRSIGPTALCALEAKRTKDSASHRG